VASGIASTDKLRIDGPAARVNMSGEVDLARETQKLNVKVVPGIIEAMSLAGFAGGPIFGALGIGIGRIFREPLEHFISYDYVVTGTWSKPVVVTNAQRPGVLEAGRE
jgi:uncharacterized protein YhdP